MVANLIDLRMGWWNLDLLHSIFNETDVEAIPKIPLSLPGCADRLVWRGTSNGCLLVKITYHLQKQLMNLSVRESSMKGHCEVFWKRLWSLQVITNVVKIFLWHACVDALPTKMNLYKKHVITDPLCPFCLQ